MVPGIQQGGHLEDNSNETVVTEENSMNDDVNPSNSNETVVTEDNSMNDDVNHSNRGNNESETVDDEENYQQLIQPERSSPIGTRTRTRTGIVIRPPDRL